MNSDSGFIVNDGSAGEVHPVRAAAHDDLLGVARKPVLGIGGHMNQDENPGHKETAGWPPKLLVVLDGKVIREGLPGRLDVLRALQLAVKLWAWAIRCVWGRELDVLAVLIELWDGCAYPGSGRNCPNHRPAEMVLLRIDVQMPLLPARQRSAMPGLNWVHVNTTVSERRGSVA